MSAPEIPVFRAGGCQDCHSNQTRWPPQSQVAPFSWLLTRDVSQGRDQLNFSSWDADDGGADDAADAVAEGSMPPRRYVLVHPEPPSASPSARPWWTPWRRWTGPAVVGDGDNSGPGGG